MPLNFEMAATDEMQAIALRHKPHAVCIVPEKREERTTEGGLEVARDENRLAHFIAPLRRCGLPRVDLHRRRSAPDRGRRTGSARRWSNCTRAPIAMPHAEGDAEARDAELGRLLDGARRAADLGLEVHMGHGLDYETVPPVAACPEVAELNIGHFLMGEALFVGLAGSIAEMRRVMDAART
jgi:pyridoxine 5-phosphate synthase